MASAKHEKPQGPASYQTIMTRRGVTDPTELKAEDLVIHNRRLSGPGTRSKNPYKFDKAAKTAQ